MLKLNIKGRAGRDSLYVLQALQTMMLTHLQIVCALLFVVILVEQVVQPGDK